MLYEFPLGFRQFHILWCYHFRLFPGSMPCYEQNESEFLQKLMNKANIGWWEADLKAETYKCSELISQLLGNRRRRAHQFRRFQQAYSKRRSGIRNFFVCFLEACLATNPYMTFGSIKQVYFFYSLLYFVKRRKSCVSLIFF